MEPLEPHAIGTLADARGIALDSALDGIADLATPVAVYGAAVAVAGPDRLFEIIVAITSITENL